MVDIQPKSHDSGAGGVWEGRGGEGGVGSASQPASRPSVVMPILAIEVGGGNAEGMSDGERGDLTHYHDHCYNHLHHTSVCLFLLALCCSADSGRGGGVKVVGLVLRGRVFGGWLVGDGVEKKNKKKK